MSSLLCLHIHQTLYRINYLFQNGRLLLRCIVLLSPTRIYFDDQTRKDFQDTGVTVRHFYSNTDTFYIYSNELSFDIWPKYADNFVKYADIFVLYFLFKNESAQYDTRQNRRSLHWNSTYFAKQKTLRICIWIIPLKKSYCKGISFHEEKNSNCFENYN